MRAPAGADRRGPPRGGPPSRALSALGLGVLRFEAEGEERARRRPEREASRPRRDAMGGWHRRPRVRVRSDGTPPCRGGRGMSFLVGSLVQIPSGVQCAAPVQSARQRRQTSEALAAARSLSRPPDGHRGM